MIQETKEQQQMYNLFRSFIYIFLIIELVMHMPVHTGSSIANSFLQMIARLGFFNSVVSCKVIELVTILITCAGTTARRSLKFDVRTMVVYPCAAGITLTVLCIFIQPGHWGTSIAGYSLNRLLYLICSVVGVMCIHRSLDAIAQYFNCKLGEDRFNFENESFQQCEQLVENKYSVNIPMIFYYKGRMRKGWCNVVNPFRYFSLIFSINIIISPSPALRASSDTYSDVINIGLPQGARKKLLYSL